MAVVKNYSVVLKMVEKPKRVCWWNLTEFIAVNAHGRLQELAHKKIHMTALHPIKIHDDIYAS
jgi:hypothetical protein